MFSKIAQFTLVLALGSTAWAGGPKKTTLLIKAEQVTQVSDEGSKEFGQLYVDYKKPSGAITSLILYCRAKDSCDGDVADIKMIFREGHKVKIELGSKTGPMKDVRVVKATTAETIAYLKFKNAALEKENSELKARLGEDKGVSSLLIKEEEDGPKTIDVSGAAPVAP